MGTPENVEYVFVRDNLRVESDLHNFGVTGSFAADLLIGWVFNDTA